MTREEKQKAIDTLEISSPFVAVTQEEFIDYQQTINKIIDWLEQEPTYMIDKSNFSQEQYKADLQCAYDCGKSIIDKIIVEIGQEIVPRNSDQYDYEAMWQNMGLRMALKVIGKYKAYKGTEHWISAADHYICPVCGLIVVNPNHFIGRRCPQCGFQDKKDKEQEDGNDDC